MRVIHSAGELRSALAAAPAVTLVPTMGGLHQGHVSLVHAARATGAIVVTSIFVNPLQFAPSEDFSAYPRTLERDCELLEAQGCDIVFAPDERDMYPQPQTFTVSPDPGLAGMLEGAARPGFFAGVCTVVLKLLSIVGPQHACFGKKDYQQLRVIERMVDEFNLDVGIIAVDTVREATGLALSSRNAFLSPADRSEGGRLYRTLQATAAAVRQRPGQWQAAEAEARRSLASEGRWVPDYIAVRCRADLGEPRVGEPLVVLGAARLGRTRLIDSLEF